MVTVSEGPNVPASYIVKTQLPCQCFASLTIAGS